MKIPATAADDNDTDDESRSRGLPLRRTGTASVGEESIRPQSNLGDLATVLRNAKRPTAALTKTPGERRLFIANCLQEALDLVAANSSFHQEDDAIGFTKE